MIRSIKPQSDIVYKSKMNSANIRVNDWFIYYIGLISVGNYTVEMKPRVQYRAVNYRV